MVIAIKMVNIHIHQISRSSLLLSSLCYFLLNLVMEECPISCLVRGYIQPEAMSLRTSKILSKSSLSPSSENPVKRSTMKPFLKHNILGKKTNLILFTKKGAFSASIDTNLHS